MARLSGDPGFGIKVGPSTGRILNRDGKPNVKRFGERFHPSDVYHWLVDMSWIRFVCVVLATYFVVNMLFAGLYVFIGPDHISNVDDDLTLETLEMTFLFSAQTLTTVGYGNLAPTTPVLGAIAALEALTGLLIFGIFTGVSFGRFTRIKPRILFSTSALMSPHTNGTNALMVRIVNERNSVVMDGNATMILVMHQGNEQQRERRYYQLPLDLANINTLALNWTLVHTITSDSVLYGLNHEDLVDRNAELLVTFAAFDDTVSQQFYTRNSYKPHEITWGARFSPMFWTNEHGDVELHIDKTHDYVSADLFPTGQES